MSEPTTTTLQRKPDGLYLDGSTLTYRVTGLTTFNLERLKITLKAFSHQGDVRRPTFISTSRTSSQSPKLRPSCHPGLLSPARGQRHQD